ncbi:MAG: DinB family protein [Candidatus Latescibacterota bacterium]|jgi:uncharacterized damage-inducible protein DinB
MYRTIDDFIEDWKGENAATIKILEALTDASLSRKVTPEGRSLGYLAWHITLSIVEMGNRAGLNIKGPAEDSSEPAHAADIVKVYRDAANQLGESVRKLWTDSSLDEELDMYGQVWKKRLILTVLLRHEAHHRGQMTVLMRQAGLKIPGIYGPSKEEWSAYGMPPQK